MKFNGWKLQCPWRVFGVCLLSAPLLAACAKPTPPLSIHGVNYSGETFSYVVSDPNNAKNTAGGELIDPYAAGGTMCCYELPKKWRPAMKISIQSTHWLGKVADKSFHEVVGMHVVEIPRYPDGKPGELWVLRASDGSMSVVSSDFQPDHPNWPGKVKGWPVASLAYQRERWDLYIEHEKGGVRLYEQLLAELNQTPDDRAKKAWDFSFADDRKSLEGYSGPEDVKFRDMLRHDYAEELRLTRQRLERLEKDRP